MKFLLEYKEVLFLILGAIIGSFIPLAKVNFIGKTIGSKLPKKARIQLANYIDAFEKGLRNQDYRGDKNLITNNQLIEKTKILKSDLGLDQHSKKIKK